MVTLNVNGRRYDVTCGDGEEGRLRSLGAALDQRVRRLAASLGQVGEARLLLLTCLLLEDEVADARSVGAALLREPGDSVGGTPLEALAPELDALTDRIEAVAGRLKPT